MPLGMLSICWQAHPILNQPHLLLPASPSRWWPALKVQLMKAMCRPTAPARFAVSRACNYHHRQASSQNLSALARPAPLISTSLQLPDLTLSSTHLFTLPVQTTAWLLVWLPLNWHVYWQAQSLERDEPSPWRKTAPHTRGHSLNRPCADPLWASGSHQLFPQTAAFLHAAY